MSAVLEFYSERQ